MYRNVYFCRQRKWVVKRVIVSVTNDLSTDQRVHKSCVLLQEAGWDVVLVGRKLGDSLPLNRIYKTHRFRLFFKKGPLFYANYSIRLFFFLLFRKADLLWSNDLDTLWPNYWVSKVKDCPLVYDTHEYFTGVPELEARPRIQRIWKAIEKSIFPKLKHVITVNQSIANLYKKEYGLDLTVVRNIPPTFDVRTPSNRENWGLPENEIVFILQGSGINIDRGAEESVMALAQTDSAHLVILGGGDVIPALNEIVSRFKLENRVHFFPRMPYEKMMECTRLADVGLTLDKDTNVNYRYSLPNKLFDYLQAGIAVLASGVVEVKRIVTDYNLGLIIPSHDPSDIALQMNKLIQDEEKLNRFKLNAKSAALELHWDIEKTSLTQMIDRFV